MLLYRYESMTWINTFTSYKAASIAGVFAVEIDEDHREFRKQRDFVFV